MTKLETSTLDQARTCYSLCRWSARVRQTFFNTNAFEPAIAAPSRWRRAVRWTLNIPIVLGAAALIFYFLPSAIFKLPRLQQNRVLGETTTATEDLNTPIFGELGLGADTLIQPVLEQNFGGEKIQPTYDLSAPEGRWFRTANAAINAEILTNGDLADTKVVDDLMSRGAYLYPDYGEIGRIGRTVVLAGHHYNMWVSPFESQKTFQNLDQVQVGDTIEIVDDYKVWTYEVYKVEEAETISEKTADLIAYTCVYWWDSKLRFFVYARLVTGA
jgi:hypothetical protein